MLKNRIIRLEQAAVSKIPPEPAVILFADGAEPSHEQQQQIAELEAAGTKVILFTIKDCRINR